MSGSGTIPSGPTYLPPSVSASFVQPVGTAARALPVSQGAAAPLFTCDDGSGRDLDAHECAYYAVLFTDDDDRGRHFCTGVVVGTRHVLTAKHCFARYVAPPVVPGTAQSLPPGKRIALHPGQLPETYWRQSQGRIPRDIFTAIARGVDLAPAWFSFHPDRDLVLITLPEGDLERGARRIADLAGDTAPRWIAPVGLPAWQEVAAVLSGIPSRALWTRTAFSIVGVIDDDGQPLKGYGRTTLTDIGAKLAVVKHDDLWICEGTSGAGMFRRLTSPRHERARHAVVGIVSGSSQYTRCTEDELYDARTIVRLDGDVPDWIARVTEAGAVRVVSEHEGTLLSRDPSGVMMAGLP